MEEPRAGVEASLHSLREDPRVDVLLLILVVILPHGAHTETSELRRKFSKSLQLLKAYQNRLSAMQVRLRHSYHC